MSWTQAFYSFQEQLTGCYEAPIHPFHRELAARITAHGGGPGRLLELGAGGGQFAVSAAQLGHEVTAVELLPQFGEHIERLAREKNTSVRVVVGDFYEVEFGGPFDFVCYWDGFGIGEDADQRRLLRRMASELSPEGRAYLDVYTPWYWAHHAGYERAEEGQGGRPAHAQRYGFDADGCRMLDTYWAQARPEETRTQSLRCYSPADLRLLLTGTGLRLAEIWPGGFFDTKTRAWHPKVPLGECQTFVAVLEHAE